MKYTLTSGNHIPFTLTENNREKSILQNLSILLATRKGTVPMYRDFGIDQSFIDKPQSVVQALALIAVTDAVEKYEPRAKVVGVSVGHDGVSGKTEIIVEVEL